jgi:hypothetical protein
LPQLSDQIKPVPNFPKNVISYEDVTLNHMSTRGGKTALNDIFDDWKRLVGYGREIARVIQRLPSEDAINIFTFKAKGTRDYPRLFKRSLERQGIDLSQTIETPSGHKPKINVITWGMETATNRYRYAKHTIFAGVLHREALELGGATVASNRDLLGTRNLNRANEIMASEVAHIIGQAAGRSSIRIANNGKAGAGTIWLPVNTPGVLELIEEAVFPNIKVVPWLSISDDWQAGESMTDQVARQIFEVLSETRDQDSMSSNALKGLVGERITITNKTWTRASRKVAKSPPQGWTKAPRGWTYTPPVNVFKTA